MQVVLPAACSRVFGTSGGVADSSFDQEEFFARVARASVSHGYLLAVLERLRSSAQESGEVTSAWALSLLEHMLCALPFGSAEHMALHNVAAEFIEQGVSYCPPAPPAKTAFDVHAGDL